MDVGYCEKVMHSVFFSIRKVSFLEKNKVLRGLKMKKKKKFSEGTLHLLNE